MNEKIDFMSYAESAMFFYMIKRGFHNMKRRPISL